MDYTADFVIPILKNLQGHPEAPRQWSRHIDAILHEFSFVPTRHAPCVYRATIDGEDVLFLRQVDALPLPPTTQLFTTAYVMLWTASFLCL